MRAIVTVIGQDRVGIIAQVCALLAAQEINILDISQTIMQGYFTMIMLVDLSASRVPFDAIQSALDEKGKEQHLAIRIQREDIFSGMHRI